MKIKFEIDIGANEVIRLGRHAENAETDKRIEAALKVGRDALATGRAGDPIIERITGMLGGVPETVANLKAGPFGNLFEDKPTDGAVPGQKPPQDAQKPRLPRVALSEDDFSTVLYALNCAISLPTDVDLSKRLHRIRDSLRSAVLHAD